MARLLLLSNGHGEDLSGALLGRSLSEQGHDVQALPLVGQGNPYRTAGIPLLGRTREYSTGGIGYTSLRGRLTELMQGQLLHLLEQLLRLLRLAHRFDLIVVVGDVIPVIASWLCGRPAATYLVAYSSHYEGCLRLPWPCGELLATRRFLAVFSRDQLTADDLSQQLRRPVRFLGNPFMDPVLSPVPTAARCNATHRPAAGQSPAGAGEQPAAAAGRRRTASCFRKAESGPGSGAKSGIRRPEPARRFRRLAAKRRSTAASQWLHHPCAARSLFSAAAEQ